MSAFVHTIDTAGLFASGGLGAEVPEEPFFLALVVGKADHERQKKRGFWRAKPSRPSFRQFASSIIIG
jgi:hypothetical protein